MEVGLSPGDVEEAEAAWNISEAEPIDAGAKAVVNEAIAKATVHDLQVALEKGREIGLAPADFKEAETALNAAKAEAAKAKAKALLKEAIAKAANVGLSLDDFKEAEAALQAARAESGIAKPRDVVNKTIANTTVRDLEVAIESGREVGLAPADFREAEATLKAFKAEAGNAKAPAGLNEATAKAKLEVDRVREGGWTTPWRFQGGRGFSES